MLLTSGCAVGPNYKRPSVDVPGTYRGAVPREAPQPAAESLGDQKWWEVFQDQQLQALIHTALQQNYDVRIAATRILEARAQVGITRADGLPTINAGAQSFDQRCAPEILPGIRHECSPGGSLTCLGSRFLGKVSPCQRVRAGKSLGDGMGSRSSHQHTGERRCRSLLPAS